MTGRPEEAEVRDRDYISRTIATVRNHRGADNCWPQWANIFADEIERLRTENAAQGRVIEAATRLRNAGLLLRADIPCHNGCGCEEYDYCAADEWDSAIVAEAVAACAADPKEQTP